jgi:hypothetical protein
MLYFCSWYWYDSGLDSFTGFQLRAAQALMGLTQEELADIIGVSPSTIQRWQAFGGEWVEIAEGYSGKIDGAIRALERTGLQFLHNGGCGVFLSKQRRRK